MPERAPQVETYLKFIGGFRIAWGIASFAAPDLLARSIGIKPTADTRVFNAFLGSRDIAIGIQALSAARGGSQREAVAMNQACEIVDTCVVAQEVLRGRPFGYFTVAGVVFNASQHLAWAHSRRLLKD
jgi:hypothetical protein